MPTDDVLTLIAEMRAKADAFVYMSFDPDEPPTMSVTQQPGQRLFNVAGNMLDEQPILMDLLPDEADYFALLDPALVRALLDVAEAQVRYIAREEAADPDNDDHLPDYYAAIQGWTDAISALRSLAADRVAS